jgi:hypothetical protein
MTADRLVDTYRRHKLLVALKDGDLPALTGPV